MPDIIDDANATADIFLSAALQKRQVSATLATSPTATGACLSCGEHVEPGRRWCNADCRDSWEADQRRG